ncbi:uncharacterized protein C16orf96 homolog isoform X2 [Macrotis lagotis]|uniref:uncharacterized protein C16orf96 homolog isoform X2 n=1 Tax=Macrotis lagotis TaxID=92651 RepID=UPI003D69B66D
MSFTVKFKELLNLAIGTPEKGVVNFNALHIFLQSIIEHLNIEEQEKVLPGSEKDYLSVSHFQGTAGEKSEMQMLYHMLSDTSDRIINTFDRRLSVVESQMSYLEALPSTEQLLESSEPFKKPAQEMWQMLKLKKKVEGNEEGMTKAMKTLQELLTSVYSLQSDTNYFKNELEQLMKKVDKISLDEVNKQSQEMKDQQEQVKNLQLDMVPEGNSSSTMTIKQLLAGHPLSAEGKRLTAKQSVGSLINLTTDFNSLKKQFAKLENKVQEQSNQTANLQFLSSIGLTPQLETEINILQDKNKIYEEHLEKVQGHCNLLEKITSILQNKVEDIKDLKILVNELEMRMVDKTWLEEEMKEKADKSALIFKANQTDLEVSTVKLNDMIHDIMHKMTIHEQNWQKMLEKLFSDVDSKLGHMDLDPVKIDMENIWKIVKKHLSDGPHFDVDRAAGLKKQLFERMKCISCDRPVQIMTSPQMISIQKEDIYSHAWPTSPNNFEYLQQLKLSKQRRMQQLQPVQEMTQLPEQADMPPHGHLFGDNCSNLRRVVKLPNLTTVYPYGNPAVFPGENAEVNILGVDGVMYKGRMTPHGSLPPVTTEKDQAGLKTTRPPRFHSGYDRMCPKISNALYPALRPRTSMTAQDLQRFPLQPIPTSSTLQHLPTSSTANISSAIDRTTREATGVDPFIIKPGSASLSGNNFSPIASEKRNNM